MLSDATSKFEIIDIVRCLLKSVEDRQDWNRVRVVKLMISGQRIPGFDDSVGGLV